MNALARVLPLIAAAALPICAPSPRIAVTGVAVAAPAAAQAAPVCRPATIAAGLVDRGKLSEQDVKLGREVTSVRCRDLTGDGVRDALFAVASGGTAGNTNFGILVGRPGGEPGRLALYRQGYKVGIAVTAGQPEVLQPIYRRDDPNCCPSSFEIRRYRWTGERFRLRSHHRTRSAPKRFRG